MEHFYESIQGAFTFHDLYSWFAKKFPKGRIVEVGVFAGRSAAYLGVELINAGSQCKLDLVDYFGDRSMDTVRQSLGPIASVLGEMHAGCSWEQAVKYADGSLDAVFIDAGHTKECVLNDIRAWLPKVKDGGILAGHDFATDIPGVIDAVNEAFEMYSVWRGTKYENGNYYPSWVVEKKASGVTKPVDPSAIYDESFFSRYISDAEKMKARDGGTSEYEFLADVLMKTWPAAQTVTDIGCGPGLVLDRFRVAGKTVLGIDGSDRAFDAAPASIRPYLRIVDLTQWEPKGREIPTDLVICTEVAEHLDAVHADKLVRDLAGLTKTTLFFTAAIPGQGGENHVNEQPNEYWITKFRANGMTLQAEQTEALRRELREKMKHCWWIPQNALVFSKEPLKASVYPVSVAPLARALHESVSFDSALILGESKDALKLSDELRAFDATYSTHTSVEIEATVAVDLGVALEADLHPMLIQLLVESARDLIFLLHANAKTVEILQAQGWESLGRSLWFRERHPSFATATFFGPKKPGTVGAEPTVSVIIPCKGQLAFLSEAISSASVQTFPAHEIILVTDDAEVLERYGERYRVIADGSKGLANARNVGIEAATGELIVCLDADDKLDPLFLEKTVNVTVWAGEDVIVATNLKEFGPNAHPDWVLEVTPDKLARGYTTQMCLFSKKLWEKVRADNGTGYDVASPKEDWAFWLDCEKHRPTVHGVPKVLVYYRRHETQSTKTDPYAAFMAATRWLRPMLFARTPEDRALLSDPKLLAWVDKRLSNFPDNEDLRELRRTGRIADGVEGASGSSESSEKKICLCMIVKNEAHVLRRCFTSLAGQIDAWCVVDTGSTDGTQALVQELLGHLPGHLHERSWQNFEHNRNEAIELARQEGCEYLFVIDADDRLEGTLSRDLTADVYELSILHNALDHKRPQLFRASMDFRYYGVVHEYLGSPPGASMETLAGARIVIEGGGARSQLPDKFLRDAALLEEALVKEPTHPRNNFYLGQSYRDAGVLDKARAAYEARAALGGFEEEVFEALLAIAKIDEELFTKDIPRVTESYLRAYEARPARAESLYYLGRFLRMKHGAFGRALPFVLTAASVPRPGDRLFVEDDVYAWRAMDETAVNLYWLGRHKEAIVFCERILAEGFLPEWETERVKANLAFSREHV